MRANSVVETSPGKSGWVARLRRALHLSGAEGPVEPPHEEFLYRVDRVVDERYRTLAWMLDQLRQRQPFKVLALTSSVPSEGKSTIAINLAAVLAEQSGRRVLVIECDLRRPRLLDILGGQQPGTMELLEGTCTLAQALHTSDQVGFKYVPVITPLDEPLRLLANTRRMAEILTQAREQFDDIILDSPPVIPVADPIFLAHAADAVLFVVRAGETPGRMINRSISLIGKEKLLGVVFNGTHRGMRYRYDPYYYKHRYYKKQREGVPRRP